MNEDEATRMLDGLTSGLPVSTAPVEQALRIGRRNQQRRRGFQVTGLAAAVGLIAVGGFALKPDSNGGTTTSGPTTPVPSTALEAPPGTRLVGMGGVAVAVPQSWGTDDVGCGGSPGTDTVTFNNDGPWLAVPCAPPIWSGSWVSVIDETSTAWRSRLSLPGALVELGGAVGRRTPTRCSESVPAQCSATLTFPDEGVSFEVNSPEADVIDEILGSSRLIPEGYTAVPDLAALDDISVGMRLLEEVGLAWEACVPHFLCAAPLGPTDPAAGSIVPVGSTVRSARMPSRPPKPFPSPVTLSTSDWKPGDGAMLASLVNSTLAVTSQGCVYARSVDGTQRTDLVWPAGYTATRNADRTVSVLDPDGVTVGRTGEQFQGGGGFLPSRADSNVLCRAGQSVFYLEGVLPALDTLQQPHNATVKVPDLAGLPQSEAVDELRALGLVPRTEEGPAPCTTWHSIFFQRPAPGSVVSVGHKVLLLTAARSAGMPVCPNDATSDQNRAVVHRFLRFADDPGGVVPPIDGPVTISLGLARVKTIPASRVANEAAWAVPLNGYAGGEGTVSPLTLLRDNRDNRLLTFGAHPVCVGHAVTPRSLSLQPRRYDSCLDWWSVDLSVSGGQVLGVTVYLYEP